MVFALHRGVICPSRAPPGVLIWPSLRVGLSNSVPVRQLSGHVVLLLIPIIRPLTYILVRLIVNC